ncbi:hypothetical protein MTR_7g103580 [Medicago truncatula]|uniref:Uncharacterized protein n=1 Tax=Medicago truncatula TaxID=3880 RepID=A0A072U333_MEDTR|nr:hypothetical protein MTR_7g103580 [Medicago truncatula]
MREEQLPNLMTQTKGYPMSYFHDTKTYLWEKKAREIVHIEVRTTTLVRETPHSYQKSKNLKPMGLWVLSVISQCCEDEDMWPTLIFKSKKSAEDAMSSRRTANPTPFAFICTL